MQLPQQIRNPLGDRFGYFRSPCELTPDSRLDFFYQLVPARCFSGNAMGSAVRHDVVLVAQ